MKEVPLNHSKLKIVIFLDGLCHLCGSEAKALHLLSPGITSAAFVDISSASFSPTTWGVDPKGVHAELNVLRLKDKKLLIGYPAVVEVWNQVPSLGPLIPILNFPGLRHVGSLLYQIFAKVRMNLPQRSCSVMSDLHKKVTILKDPRELDLM